MQHAQRLAKATPAINPTLAALGKQLLPTLIVKTPKAPKLRKDIDSGKPKYSRKDSILFTFFSCLIQTIIYKQSIIINHIRN
jgi:hypothetical protein